MAAQKGHSLVEVVRLCSALSAFSAFAFALFSPALPLYLSTATALSQQRSDLDSPLNETSSTTEPTRLIARQDCIVPCGWANQLCCAANQVCYTDNNDEAQCSSTAVTTITATTLSVVLTTVTTHASATRPHIRTFPSTTPVSRTIFLSETAVVSTIAVLSTTDVILTTPVTLRGSVQSNPTSVIAPTSTDSGWIYPYPIAAGSDSAQISPDADPTSGGLPIWARAVIIAVVAAVVIALSYMLWELWLKHWLLRSFRSNRDRPMAPLEDFEMNVPRRGDTVRIGQTRSQQVQYPDTPSFQPDLQSSELSDRYNEYEAATSRAARQAPPPPYRGHPPPKLQPGRALRPESQHSPNSGRQPNLQEPRLSRRPLPGVQAYSDNVEER